MASDIYALICSPKLLKTKHLIMLQIIKKAYGKTADGQSVELYSLSNGSQMEVDICIYGGTITAIKVPDKEGKLDNVVLGFDKLEDYLGEHPKIGVTIGRYANRIAKGKFSLEGKEYNLTQNENDNHIHGGNEGFDKKVWKTKTVIEADKAILELNCQSFDGEEGYPGNLNVKVTYTLTVDGSLVIQYKATTDKTTIVNLTNHSYFNLNLSQQTDIKQHYLTIQADYYLPIDSTSIPTGEIKSVKNTAFDLRKPQSIQSILDKNAEEINQTNGIDHCFVLKQTNDLDMKLAAILFEPESKRKLEVFTSEPGVQVYTGNFLSPKFGFQPHQALCLETQHFPDSPNQAYFPSTVLSPHQDFVSTTIYKFSVED